MNVLEEYFLFSSFEQKGNRGKRYGMNQGSLITIWHCMVQKSLLWDTHTSEDT